MQRDADTLFPADNVEIAAELVASEARVDGRRLDATRPVTIDILPDDTGATVALGSTRMHAAVTAELPSDSGSAAKSGSDGRLALDVKWSPMGSSSFTGNTRHERHAMEISTLLQRVIVDGAMVDLEALTVQRGRLAWTLYLDIIVLCDSGNLIDCAVMAAMAALASFRLPQTEVTPAGDLTIFPANEREPLPLTIHHIPFAVSFVMFDEGNVVVMDPTRGEPEAAQGSMTVLMSEHGELCGIHKVEGSPVSPDVAMRCVRLATARAARLGADLHEALRVHELARVYARVRQIGGGVDGQAMGSTAKAAEQVHAARVKGLPRATGEASLPRTEVTISQAVPAKQLPNLGALAVSGGVGRGEPAQSDRLGASLPVAGEAATKEQAASDKMKAGDARSHGTPPQDSERAGVGALAVPGEPVAEDPDAMDVDASVPGVGVRASSGNIQGAANVAGSKKKTKKPGIKRASPGETSKGFRDDTFEEIAQMISGGQSQGAGAPSLAACVKTPKKKRKEQK